MALWACRSSPGLQTRDSPSPPSHVLRNTARMQAASPYLSPSRLADRMGLGWRNALAASTPQPATLLPSVDDIPRYAECFDRSLKQQALFLNTEFTVPLRSHQEEGVAFMRAHEVTREYGVGGGIVGDLMRTGKTRMLWALIFDDLQARVRAHQPRFGRPTLIVVPKAAVAVWLIECQRLFVKNPLRILQVCEGDHVVTPPHALMRDADVVLTTYSTLAIADNGQKYTALFEVEWLRVIADEAHCFVDAHSNRFAHMMQLRATVSKWFVSGTPIMNHMSDLINALRFVGLARDAIPDPLTQPDAWAQMRAALILRRGFTATAEGDEDTEDSVHVEQVPFATDAELRCYTYHLDRERQVMEDDDTPATNILQTITRLRQLCVVPTLVELPPELVHVDKSSDAYRRVRSAVYNEVLFGQPMSQDDADFVRTASFLPPVFTKERHVFHQLRTVVEPAREKLVIYSPWTSVLDRLDNLLTKRRLYMPSAPSHVYMHGDVLSHMRTAMLDDFCTNPQHSCLLITTGTGAVAIDLSAASHLIHMNSNWNPATEDQASSRIHMQGRAGNVTCITVGGTLEAGILTLQNKKRALGDVVPIDKLQRKEDAEADERWLLNFALDAARDLL